MDFSLFSKLATDSSLSRTQAFSQQTWRKHHYSPDQGTLCSGLTYFWLHEKLRSRSPMSQLEEPSPELLHHLTSMQALSHYPSFPENFIPGERELSLLNEKYGTQDWKEIQRCVVNEHQGDYILYDLSRMFRYDSASIVRFTDLPKTLPCIKPLPTGSAVIGVLRYLEDGQPGGHRVAYYFDRKNQHHFFDPNAGEVVESRDTGFHQWLDTFLIHAVYRKFECSIKESFLTLYKLINVSPQIQNIFPRHLD